ncbi:MAG TPA: hypothetical protein VF230_19475 [Acidimicrobiales bacterium]
MAISVRIDPERLAAPAGSDVDGTVSLTNPHDAAVHVRVVVSGEIAGWASVEPSELLLGPGETVDCQLRIRLPRGAPGGVGHVPFVVRALSDVEGIGGATAEGWLAVEGQAELALRVVPGTPRGTVAASAKVAADNLGDLPARAQLVVQAPDTAAVGIEPDSVIIEPGETAWAKVTIRPHKKFFSGPVRSHEFWVRLEPLGGARVSVEGRMAQRSLLVGVVPKVVATVAAVALFAFGLGQMAGSERPTELSSDSPIVTSTTTTTTAPATTAPPPSAGATVPPPTTTTIPLKDRPIAFQSMRDDNFEIYASKPDGSEPRNLTLNLAHDSEPAWSPDGSRIAFDSDRSGNFDVWVMNADGTNPIQLTTELTPDGYPTWSPDGTRLAFLTFRDGNSEIYVMNADGTGQARLTKNAADDGRPMWSPDGSKIAFHTYRDGNYEIYVMNADGTSPVNLSNNPAADQNPSWAPNGARLAFDSTRDAPKSELYLMGADGSLPVRLTTNDAVDKWADWSPDGTKIVFQSDREADMELYTIGAGGGNAKRITEFPGVDAEPTW